MTTQRERFLTILTGQYEYLFTLPQYAMAAARTTPATMAEKFVQGLIDGTADHEGEGVKRTCAALGVKKTRKAIREFLSR